MTTTIHVVALVLGVVGVCHGALAAEAPVAPPAQIDVQLAARLLAQARLEFPVAAEVLWKNSDGLPNPTEARFAAEVSGFLEKHPVTAPDAAKPDLWEIGETASRQLKCLAYLAKGSEEARQDVARLCVVQATEVQWAFPVRAGSRAKVDDTFCAAAAGLTMTGELLYRGAGQDPTLREVAAQWMRTGTGQVAGNPSPDDPKWRAASAMIERAAAPPDLRDLHGTDEGFFSQIDLTRHDMREVARRAAAKDWEGARKSGKSGDTIQWR